MKSVYLDYASNTHEYYLETQGYDQVRTLVMKLRICATCKLPYDIDKERPCVGLRICLSCFLKKHPNLKFLEVQTVNSEQEYTYAFLDEAGNVYTSQENYTDTPGKDIAYTLKQHQFTPPAQYKPLKSTDLIRLHPSHFTVYGDLHSASVIVVDYNDYYDKVHVAFLLYKHAGHKELTKRGEGKVLWEKAQTMLERTKRGSYYLINGHEQSRIWESDIYRLISQMESAVYDISMQFAPPVPIEGETNHARTAQSLREDQNEGQPVRDLAEPEPDVEVPDPEEIQTGSDQ